MTAEGEAYMTLGEVTFRIRALERELERVERAQATFVTQETFSLKLQISVGEINSKIDALTKTITELHEQRTQSRKMATSGLLYPVISGILVAILVALILAGIA